MSLPAALAAGLDDESLPRPSDYEIHGIDVSKYQGDIDWNSVRASGVQFAWIKATEGGDRAGREIRAKLGWGEGCGIPRGAYHFAYWCRPAEEQAAWFKANVPNDPDALPPVLDVEWNGQSKTCPKRLPREVAIEQMKIILAAMEEAMARSRSSILQSISIVT